MPSFASYPSLKDKSVFVSGGGSGIGASIVEHFAAQGSKVGFVDIDEAASTDAREEDRRAVHQMRHPRREGLSGGDRQVASKHGPITALVNNAARDDRHEHRRRDARVLGRAHGGQSAPRLFRHPGGGARHEEGGRRIDRELQLGELPHDDAQPLGLSVGQGRGDRHDARPGARSRGRQDPAERDNAGLDHDPAPDRPVADAGGRGRPDEGAGAQGEGLSRRHRADGAVPGLRRQPPDLGAEFRRRWRADVHAGNERTALFMAPGAPTPVPRSATPSRSTAGSSSPDRCRPIPTTIRGRCHPTSRARPCGSWRISRSCWPG